jgi:DNA-binding transcriptional LysR family regulator
MDSEALQTFVTIHRTGSFSLTAEMLNRSQPAISRRIAVLEQELEVRLFERASGGVVLSQAGRVLLPFAERVLAAMNDAADALAELRHGNSGPIVIAAVGTLTNTSLTRVLKQFAAQLPDVTLSLRTATSKEVSELVRSGEVTIGLRYFVDPADDVICHALTPERLVVVCAPEHRLAERRVARLRSLAAEHWLAFTHSPASEPSAGNLFAQFQRRGVAEIAWTAIDSLTAQKRLVEAGFGLALVPESSIAEERAAKSLAMVSVGDLEAENPVVAVVRRNGYLSPASAKLLELLKAEVITASRSPHPA